MPFPTTYSYSLYISTITTSTTKPTFQGPKTVTFGTGYYTIDGVKYTYTQIWGREGTDKVILKLSNGSYMMLADPINYSQSFTLKYGTSTWTLDFGQPMLDNLVLVAGNDNFIPSYQVPYPCFLSGTEIRAGEKVVAIEDIKIGDEIDVFGHDGVQSRKVVWLGKSHATVKPDYGVSNAGYPVCIVQGAIADGVPYRDMRVTPEHSFFFEGKLVPVRMLVNGRTIYYDLDYTTYDYYHVELEQHSVIMADGALTESFLDTGHKSFSRGVSTSTKSWAQDAAFPLDTTRSFVESIFRRIEMRAETLGVAMKAEAVREVRKNPTYLETSCGKVIMPLRCANDRLVFQIPESVTHVTLRSDSARPCDAIGPYIDDRRELGLLVGELELYDADATRLINLTNVDALRFGWHSSDTAETRWTDGAGRVFLPERDSVGTALLSVQVLATGADMN